LFALQSTTMFSTIGTVEFKVPCLSAPATTWYQAFGGNWKAPDTVPLIILHGGPGACHDYVLPHTDLARPDRPVIFYDQIGCGRSSHFPERAGDDSFWTVDLFIRELNNLLAYLGLQDRPIDVLGHSWGGMLAAVWAATSEESGNLRRLVISSSLASMDLWRQSVEAFKKQLPRDVQRVLDKGERELNFTSPEYQAAIDLFFQRHLSLARPWPPREAQAALDCFAKDPTTVNTMYVVLSTTCPRKSANMLLTDPDLTSRYGPSELHISGSLRNWTVIPDLHKIKVPTLLLNGKVDMAQDAVVQPFFDNLDKVKWATLERAGHLAYVDQRKRYMQLVDEFLGSE